MLLALLSIVGGVVLMVCGAWFTLGGFRTAAAEIVTSKDKRYAWSAMIAGIVITIFGVFVEFYMGWWGVIRAIIDYAKT